MKRILIIDDELDLAESMAALLESEGYSARAVASAKAGMDELAKVIPDLIILDVMMPFVKGTDMVKTLREDKRFTQIPILLTSASREPEKSAHQWNKFLRKPFDIEELVSDVRSLL